MRRNAILVKVTCGGLWFLVSGCGVPHSLVAEPEEPSPSAIVARATDKPKTKMAPELILANLEPLDFSLETRESIKDEIKQAGEVLADFWAPGRKMARAQNVVLKHGFHAVPVLINIIIELDYGDDVGVEHASMIWRLLGDICNNQGIPLRTRPRGDGPAPWDNERDIRWNRYAAAGYYKLWRKLGGSKKKWDAKFSRAKGGR